MNLDELRDRLTLLDQQIIEIIGERQSIVSEIGKYKQQVGRATRDYARESAVLTMAKTNALDVGIDPKLAEEVLQLLIQSSLTNQERARVVAEGKGDGRKVLVIGGSGKMGRWFVEFFDSQGFITFVADKEVEDGTHSFSDCHDAGIDYDVIVVATPIEISATILLELSKMDPQGLIFDIGSLKTPLRDGLNALFQNNCLVTSIHPMFGPGTELLSGKHLIYVDVGNEIATEKAKDLFSATMVKKLDMDIDDHDRLIAYVLGLSHALNIAFFNALADSGESAPKLAKLSSTTFDAQLIVAEAVASDSPELYFEIQKLNDYGLAPLNALCASANQIRKVIQDNNKDGFIELMEKGKKYLATRN